MSGRSRHSSGSSPRARGTVRRRGLHVVPVRFIPASAGNGCSRLGLDPMKAVHPRERGERPNSRLTALLNDGSSPRARGTASAAHAQTRLRRFIPASAGNGVECDQRTPLGAVHPRERGDRRLSQRRKPARGGSSPRARGTACACVHICARVRFIPASAGNGRSRRPGWPARPVHPRERGERAGDGGCGAEKDGSSPRARGTAQERAPVAPGVRFIPASAGNGSFWPRSQLDSSVHPRERGERFLCPFLLGGGGGSSPRARGTVPNSPHIRQEARFIPASAGNGRPRVRAGSSRPVHPRERGERYLPAV